MYKTTTRNEQRTSLRHYRKSDLLSFLGNSAFNFVHCRTIPCNRNSRCTLASVACISTYFAFRNLFSDEVFRTAFAIKQASRLQILHHFTALHSSWILFNVVNCNCFVAWHLINNKFFICFDSFIFADFCLT